MPFRISGIRLHLDEPESNLAGRLARALGVPPSSLGPWRILRKSLDARDKGDLQFIYAVEVGLPEGEGRVAELALRTLSRKAGKGGVRVEPYEEPPFLLPEPGDRPLPHRPVVVGSGPGGLVAA